jgi:hypothetical protein
MVTRSLPGGSPRSGASSRASAGGGQKTIMQPPEKSGCATATPLARLPSMAFHETFWVVTGAAAPVLGLAAVLSASDLFDLTDTISALILAHRRQAMRQLVRLEPPEGRGYVPKNKLLSQLIDDRVNELRRQLRIVTSTAIAQAVNILAQAVLLAVSLWAITSQANEGPPLLWLAVAVLGLAILSVAGLQRVWVRTSRSKWHKSGIESQIADSIDDRT